MNWVPKSMLPLDQVTVSVLRICDRITLLGISGTIIAMLVSILAGCGERLRRMEHPQFAVQYATTIYQDVPAYGKGENRPSEEAA